MGHFNAALVPRYALKSPSLWALWLLRNNGSIMDNGIIDKIKNPFAIPSWIEQGYGLTYKKKRNRQENLPALFNRTPDEILKLNRNEGKYLAFVAIRWGFAEIIDNRLTPTEIWHNRIQYDEYGIKLKINMNKDFEAIKSVLSELRSDYIAKCHLDILDENAPITERDIVADIYCRLKNNFYDRDLSVHCEIKPASSENAQTEELRRLPKIDVGILSNKSGRSWLSSAIKLQNNYRKGHIEARFSSIPVEYFHTAIEVKIQSKFSDAKKDIDTLRTLLDSNDECNCFFVLMNARGQRADHDKIQKYANQMGICMFEYTCR